MLLNVNFEFYSSDKYIIILVFLRKRGLNSPSFSCCGFGSDRKGKKFKYVSIFHTVILNKTFYDLFLFHEICFTEIIFSFIIGNKLFYNALNNLNKNYRPKMDPELWEKLVAQ